MRFLRLFQMRINGGLCSGLQNPAMAEHLDIRAAKMATPHEWLPESGRCTCLIVSVL